MIKKDKKYSVIMASYLEDYPNAAKNRETKFVRAIVSFLKQTYENKELIIVSDGCDKTVSIFKTLFDVETLFCDKNNIKVIRLEKQEKLYNGIIRQTGINESSGDRILYLDSDDMIGPDHIKSIDKMFDESYDWVMYEGLFPYDNEGNLTEDKTLLKNMNDYNWKSPGQYVGTFGLCHNKKIDATWEDKIGPGEDTMFYAELQEKHSNFGVIELTESGPAYYICHQKWDNKTFDV
jgi:glycosyltransferase involved in cell wall biosynthesis